MLCIWYIFKQDWYIRCNKSWQHWL